jgi:hypothetical protein
MRLKKYGLGQATWQCNTALATSQLQQFLFSFWRRRQYIESKAAAFSSLTSERAYLLAVFLQSPSFYISAVLLAALHCMPCQTDVTTKCYLVRDDDDAAFVSLLAENPWGKRKRHLKSFFLISACWLFCPRTSAIIVHYSLQISLFLKEQEKKATTDEPNAP